MSSNDYQAYAQDLEKWYNNKEFISMRSVEELSKIFELCSFTTKQFIETFEIIRNSFGSLGILTIMQHTKIPKFENKKLLKHWNLFQKYLTIEHLMIFRPFSCLKLHKKEQQQH